MPSVVIEPRDEDAAYEDWRAREDWEEPPHPFVDRRRAPCHTAHDSFNLWESAAIAPDKGCGNLS